MRDPNGAKKLLRALTESKSAKVTTEEIVSFFHSGRDAMDAIAHLRAQGLVEFDDPVIALTDAGLRHVQHPFKRPRRPDPVLLQRAKHNIGYLVTGVFALVGFTWFLMSQVVAPSRYCPMLPATVSAWLAPCAAVKEGEN